jgi:alpha-beta hydrolase superfamily lysophospholipase
MAFRRGLDEDAVDGALPSEELDQIRKEHPNMKVSYGRKRVGDVEVFYREAGRPDAPVILLLHGFPTSGHMLRNLIPALADRYRVIAPDLPGFGNTVAPPRAGFEYSFDNLAEVIGSFVDALGLTRYALYIFDLWRADRPAAGNETSGTRHRDRYPERERLCRGP